MICPRTPAPRNRAQPDHPRMPGGLEYAAQDDPEQTCCVANIHDGAVSLVFAEIYPQGHFYPRHCRSASFTPSDGQTIGAPEVRDGLRECWDELRDRFYCRCKRVFLVLADSVCDFADVSASVALRSGWTTPPSERNLVGEPHVRALQRKACQAVRDRNRSLVTLHCTDYTVSGGANVRNPMHLAAEELRIRAQAVLSNRGLFETAVRTLADFGLNVDAALPASTAAARCLSAAETAMGTALVLVGEHFTTVALHAGGRMVGRRVLPRGTHHILANTACALNLTPASLDEEIAANRAALARSRRPDEGDPQELFEWSAGNSLNRLAGACIRFCEPLFQDIADAVDLLAAGAQTPCRRIAFAGDEPLTLNVLATAALQKPLAETVRCEVPQNPYSADMRRIPGFVSTAGIVGEYVSRGSFCERIYPALDQFFANIYFAPFSALRKAGAAACRGVVEAGAAAARRTRRATRIAAAYARAEQEARRSRGAAAVRAGNTAALAAGPSTAVAAAARRRMEGGVSDRLGRLLS